MTALDELLDFLAETDLQSLKWEIAKLRSIEQWAYDAQPFKAGDLVRIREGFDVGPPIHPDGYPNGWYGSRHCLVPGALATVEEIWHHTDRGDWLANIRLDREWGYLGYPPGERWESKPEDRHLYALRFADLELAH